MLTSKLEELTACVRRSEADAKRTHEALQRRIDVQSVELGQLQREVSAANARAAVSHEVAKAADARAAQAQDDVIAIRAVAQATESAAANALLQLKDRQADIVAAHVRLDRVEGFVGAVRLKSGRLVRATNGVVEGQLYVDAVVDAARAEASKILNEDVVAVLEAVDGGASYDDIRARIVKAYNGMQPEKLAKLTEAATIMVDLAGRHAMNEDA